MSGLWERALSQKQPSVISQTADANLLGRPLISLVDIEEIERVPVESRIAVSDFSKRIALGLAARAPDEVAITYVPDGDVNRTAERVSFRELRRNIDRTATLLRAQGIDRHDVVAVLLPAVPSLYWTIIGAMAAGIVFPLNWMMEPWHLARLLREANAKAVIALGPTPGFRIWESIQSISGELPPATKIWSIAGPGGTVLAESDLDAQIAGQADDRDVSPARDGTEIGAYVHSGGTTGLPKIVKLSHRNMSYRHWTLQLAMKLEIGEVILHDTPMFHVGGLVGRCLPPLASGASILIPSVMGARDQRYMGNYWRFVEKYRVTRLSGVPTTLAVLARSAPKDIDLSSLKPYFMTGSTAMPVSVRREFERVSGVGVLNSYGMTENTASIAIDPRDGIRKEGSSGIRVPYTRIRVVAPVEKGTGIRLCGPREIGMLQIKGPGLSSGYVNPTHDADARTEDGWLVTGDLGRVDEDGYVFVTGRAKDTIVRGGHNIDPAVIEEPLLLLREVLHAAAVGKPDRHAGEIPVAYVQLVPGARATAIELMASLTGRVAERAAIPKEIYIVDELPLTDVGKPIKSALRKDAAERAFAMAVSEATGLSSTAGELAVAVRPDPVHGQVVAIAVCGVAAAEQAAMGARISDVMSGYAFAYEVEWN
jgi:fatty-acyl-CoA synthase